MTDPTLIADLIRAGVDPELVQRVSNALLSVLAEIQCADDARHERSTAAERQARYRERKARNALRDTVTSQTVTPLRNSDVTLRNENPPYPLKKESKIPETDKESVSGPAGPTQAELEKALYARGRQVCGKQSGGLITSLLKAKEFNVALARAVIETASTKHDPREYVGAAIRSKANDPKSAIAAADRLIDRLGGVEAANGYVPGSSGPAPLCLDFGQVPAGPKLISQG